MAANTSPIFVKNVTGKATEWTNSDAAATKKVISPTIGAEGARISQIICSSTDTAARSFVLWMNNGSADFVIGTFSITNTTLDLMSILPWVAADGSFTIPTGWTLKASNVATITAATVVDFTVLGGDF